MYTLITSKVDYRVFRVSEGYPDHFHQLCKFYTPFWQILLTKLRILQKLILHRIDVNMDSDVLQRPTIAHYRA